MTTPSPAIPFKRILAAVDGSDHGLHAARAAARLARALDARLTLLAVYHAPSAALGEPNYSTALAEGLEHARENIGSALSPSSPLPHGGRAQGEGDMHRPHPHPSPLPPEGGRGRELSDTTR